MPRPFVFLFLASICSSFVPAPLQARNIDDLQRRFALLHGIDFHGQGHLHTEPRRGPQGSGQTQMTGSLRLSWSTSVQEQHGFTSQTWVGDCSNLGAQPLKNVRIEVLRSPLTGPRAGVVEVLRHQSLGTMEGQARRQVFLDHRYPNTDPADYSIRVRHD